MTMTLTRSSELESPFAQLADPGQRPTLQLVARPTNPDVRPDMESSDVFHARQLVVRFPDSPTALSRLAQALFVDGQVDEAVAVAKSVAELTTRDPDRWALLGAAYVLFNAKKFATAEAAISPLADDDAHVLRARCAIANNNQDLALKHLSGAKSYDAATMEGTVLLELGRFAEAINALRRATDRGPATSGIMLGLARAHDALGSTKKAVRAATVATGLSSLRVDAAAVLASLLFEAGDRDGALKELERVRQLRPESIRPPFLMASLRFSSGEPDALREMKRLLADERLIWRATKAERNQLETVLISSRLQVRDLSFEAARKRLLKIWVESNFEAEPAGRMAVSGMTRRADVTTIRPLIERFANTVPRRQSHWALCRLAVLDGRYDDALEEARAWLAAEPTNFFAAAPLMGLLGEVNRNPEEAIRVGTAFHQRIPRNLDIINSLAYHSILAGNLHEAERLLRTVMPETPFVTATRGLLALYQGRIAEGRVLYETASQNAAATPVGGPLSELILIRMGFALKALGEPAPKLRNVEAWHGEPSFEAWVRYYGFSL